MYFHDRRCVQEHGTRLLGSSKAGLDACYEGDDEGGKDDQKGGYEEQGFLADPRYLREVCAWWQTVFDVVGELRVVGVEVVQGYACSLWRDGLKTVD